MGGDGSTRWGYHRRRATIEEVAELTVNALRAVLPKSYAGDGSEDYRRDKGFQQFFPSLAKPPVKPRRPVKGRLPGAMHAVVPQASPPGLNDKRNVTFGVMYLNQSAELSLCGSPMRFGGHRWWLVCPGCHKNRRALYLPTKFGATHWRCRECYGLKYLSQRLERCGRTELRMQRVSKRLYSAWWENWRQSPPPKPKWMRQLTYARCVAAWERASEARDFAYDVRLVRLFARFDPRLARQLRERQ